MVPGVASTVSSCACSIVTTVGRLLACGCDINFVSEVKCNAFIRSHQRIDTLFRLAECWQKIDPHCTGKRLAHMWSPNHIEAMLCIVLCKVEICTCATAYAPERTTARIGCGWGAGSGVIELACAREDGAGVEVSTDNLTNRVWAALLHAGRGCRIK